MQSLRKSSGTFRADDPTPLLDIAEMGSGNSENLGKGRETHFIRFSKTGQGSSKRQRPAHQGCQVLRRFPTRYPLRTLSSHVRLPPRRRPSGRSRRRVPGRWLDMRRSDELPDNPSSRRSRPVSQLAAGLNRWLWYVDDGEAFQDQLDEDFPTSLIVPALGLLDDETARLEHRTLSEVPEVRASCTR